MEKDEEPGDNVMHRGAEPGGGGGKQAEERERREAEEECWKRRRREHKRESAGCVHLALGGRER